MTHEDERTAQAREQTEPARFSAQGIDRTSALEQRIANLEQRIAEMQETFDRFVALTIKNVMALEERTEQLKAWANEDRK